ncbi:MAG: lipoyl(octanoyl) transferase LipB [Polyangia bacterium]
MGLRDFRATSALQQELVQARHLGEVEDTLVLVEHPEVITSGRSGKAHDILAAGPIPVIAVERGGQVTYHGPGQLVAYPIFWLREDERDLHAFLRGLEQALILTLRDFAILATRRPGKTGVWTTDQPDARKLASIGIAVRKWVTFHGLALNVATDLSRFAAINPCGFAAEVMTSMVRELAGSVDMTQVKQALVHHLGLTLDRAWQP